MVQSWLGALLGTSFVFGFNWGSLQLEVEVTTHKIAGSAVVSRYQSVLFGSCALVGLNRMCLDMCLFQLEFLQVFPTSILSNLQKRRTNVGFEGLAHPGIEGEPCPRKADGLPGSSRLDTTSPIGSGGEKPKCAGVPV